MRHVQRKRLSDYIMPFLVIVGLGIVTILGFNLWGSLQAKPGDVYFHIAAGRGKILNYGMKEWENAYSGTKLLLGDSLKTAQSGRMVLQFFNGTIVRLGEDSEITLTDLRKNGNYEKISLTLGHGSAWINKGKSEDVSQSVVEVRTSNMLVSDLGTIFEVSNGTVETVRVLRGGVKAHILDVSAGKDQRLDTVDIGVGQEINLDSAVLKAFQNRQTPSVLMALNDNFRASDWYAWNVQEDNKPTDFAARRSDFQASTQKKTEETQHTGSQQILSTQSQQKLEKSLTLEQKSISGQKNLIKADQKTEQKLDQKKQQDLAKTVQKTQEKKQQDLAKTQQKTQQGTQQQTNQKLSLSQIVITESLKDPIVLTFNGSKSSISNWGVVKVEGEVHGAAKVVVNNFTLGKFQPGSTRWIYYANENADNLKPGLNEYEVYAVDANGKESGRVKFTITYNKSEKPVTNTRQSVTKPGTSTQQTQQKVQQTQAIKQSTQKTQQKVQ